MRVLSPEVFITVDDISVSRLYDVCVCDDTTCRLYAATDTMIRVPFGTSNSWSILPDFVEIGLESGRTSSRVAIRWMCGAVGWNRSPSYEGTGRVTMVR